METKKSIHYYGTFNGIYEWGKGWLSMPIKAKWDEFWLNEFPKYKNYRWIMAIPPADEYDGWRLVGRANVIYMHPMGFYGMMFENGITCGSYINGKEYRYVFYDDLEKLNEICKAAAEYCGGTFTLDTTKEFDIVQPEERFKFGTKEDYLPNCAKNVVPIDSLARDLNI